ncbi:MAG: hypothetical protein IJO01_06365 [Oscillospiraceae bacterium]|nr:hypothetical protein [Oscillospiraceae bacterium]
MDRKKTFELLLKNRFLILSCVVLILGTLFGTSVLKIIPEEVCGNLFIILSEKSESFMGCFLNKFCFSFVILLGIYLSGFSIIGTVLTFSTIFINGMVYGIQNGILYMFYSSDYILSGLLSYALSTLYFGFLIIIMAESSVFSSRRILDILKNKNTEKPHYNAKNQTVKFFTFTAIFMGISVFYAYILPIIQNRFEVFSLAV